MAYTKAMEQLIQEFTAFPGVGQRSAERMAFQVLRMSREQVQGLSGALVQAKESIQYCKLCNNLCESEYCVICQDSVRNRELLCVLESPKDVESIEASGTFKGMYHILLGVLAPLDGVGPDDLRIRKLYERVKEQHIKEVILALSSNMEAEATVVYISNILKPLGVRLTRIATGIPVGLSLEYTDSATLSRALEGRRELK